MALATPEQYVEMLDAARSDGYAYPAVNVSSSSALIRAPWLREGRLRR